MGAKLLWRPRETSIRIGPSSLITVFELLPFRYLVSATGLAAPDE